MHVGAEEVHVFSHEGTLAAKPVRMSGGWASDKTVRKVHDTLKSSPELRKDLLEKARAAQEHMNTHNWGNTKNRAAELQFLIKALEKPGVTGAEFIAHVISAGSLFGGTVEGRLADLTSTVPLPCMDDLTGRQNARILRRDYGLFEVTCSDGPDDWVCLSFSLEIHRLLHLPNLRDQVREHLGISFEPYTRWEDVQHEYERIPGGALESIDETMGYRVFRERSLGVTVQVVHDPSATRDGFPGHGDVWSVEIMSPRFMR